MEKHYVVFLSPGTLVAEISQVEISGWHVPEAMDMACTIKAKPYGFYFITRSRTDDELDSSETNRSDGIYYLGGKIETLAQVKARNNPDDSILISNMECNNYSHVIVNTNSFKVTLPFDPNVDSLVVS